MSTSWQLGFQDPATPVMEGIINFHHDLMFFLIVIVVFTSWIILRCFAFPPKKTTSKKFLSGPVFSVSLKSVLFGCFSLIFLYTETETQPEYFDMSSLSESDCGSDADLFFVGWEKEAAQPENKRSVPIPFEKQKAFQKFWYNQTHWCGLDLRDLNQKSLQNRAIFQTQLNQEPLFSVKGSLSSEHIYYFNNQILLPNECIKKIAEFVGKNPLYSKEYDSTICKAIFPKFKTIPSILKENPFFLKSVLSEGYLPMSDQRTDSAYFRLKFLEEPKSDEDEYDPFTLPFPFF